MSREYPILECRVAFNPGGKGDIRMKRTAFAEIMASSLRLMVPHMLALTSSALTPNDSNFRVWTERLLQGGEHRPEFLVELMPRPGVNYFDRFQPSLMHMLSSVVWAEALRIQDVYPGAGFRMVTIETRFPTTARVVVDVDSGFVKEALNTQIAVGTQYQEDAPVIIAVRNRIPGK